MRTFYYCFVLLTLFCRLTATAQQRQPVEKKVPLKVETVPVKPGFKFVKPVSSPAKPVLRVAPVSTIRNIPGMVREKLQLPAGLKTRDSKGKIISLPDQYIYRKTTSTVPAHRTNGNCGDLLLTRQSQIDSFHILYPGCDEFDNVTIAGENANPQITNLDSLKYLSQINGDLHIKHTNVINLNPLNNITRIGSYFTLEDNPDIQSLGLFNMGELGGVVFFNNSNLHQLNDLFGSLNSPSLWSVLLINLGLDDLTSLTNVNSIINIAVIDCHTITSLDGLQNLTSLDGGIQIINNNELSDISQLSGIQTIDGGGLLIINNDLTSLYGIHNITHIGGVLQLNNNYLLTTLNDFNPNLIVSNTLNANDMLEIKYNFNLSVCSVPFLCNYLATHDTADITINGGGCNTLEQIRSSCSNCDIPQEKTWTPQDNDSWSDPANWTPVGVPGTCTNVIIPYTNYDPFVDQTIQIGGLVMESGTTLDMNYHDIFVTGTLNTDNANINRVNQLTARRVYQPRLINTYIEGGFTCEDYGGESLFQSNTFVGDVIISDSIGRSEQVSAFFNTTYGDFTWINNSEYGQSYLGNASPFYDIIDGDLTVINNSYATISVGLGGDVPIKVTGNLNVQSSAGNIDINTMGFAGYQYSHIKQLGLWPVNINRLVDQKGGGELILDNDVTITSQLDLSISYSNIVVQGNRTLTMDKYSEVLPQLNNPDYAYIKGKVKKIGNTAFKFPLGGPSLNNSNKAAPLEISAPAFDTDEFTAEYIPHNPSLDGYDTAQYITGFGGINGREYWKLDRNGSSNVTVKLYYDSLRGGVAYLYNQMQVAGWNGTKWKNWSSGGYTGNILNGTVVSGMPLTQYGPLALSYKPLRKPVITIGTVDSIVCIGTSFNVPYILDTLAFTGNTYRVEASDSLGSFSNPALLTTLGTISTTSSGFISAYAPLNFHPGSRYKIRVVGNYPADTSVNTKQVIPKTTPQLSFTIVGPNPACIGNGPIKYYPSLHEPGVAYTWHLGGGGTFTTNGDTAIVTWTIPGTFNLVVQSSVVCGNGPQFSAFITVKPPAPVETPVVNNIGRWLYATAPAQTTSGYQWYKNGVLIPAATNGSYYANTAGTFTVKYKNDCGEGPVSNGINFAATSQAQTITFNPLSNKTYGDPAFTLTATASSGLPVAYIITSGPGSITGSSYTITSSGPVTINAIQLGDNTYDTAAIITRSFVVNKAAQTLTFPVIPEQNLNVSPLLLTATASSGLPVAYSVVSGPGTLSGNFFYLSAPGQVTLNAAQTGDTNYLAATPVNRSFCVRVPELTSIAGTAFACPAQNATYSINNIAGLTYTWRLSNGTTYAATTNTVNITWSTAGTYTLIVSATGPCGAASANDSLVVNVATAILPGTVSNMLPANGTPGLTLPLTLSWLPGSNALSYDLYLWDSASTVPSTPFIADMNGLSYTLSGGSLSSGKTYKWKVVSKNACLQTQGPIQTFGLKGLPDLVVSNVQLPSSAFSGQSITINWKVTNAGPGNTSTNQHWTDAVFLSFDTIPRFNNPPNTNPGAWSQLDFPVRPLLIATKPNVTALDSGQQYSNSVDFTLPLNYSQPLYAYVITNYPAGINAPVQVTYSNDTARAPQALNVTLSPTPDLRVDTVFTPGSVFSGSTINVTYKVKNYGVLTPAGSNWTDKIYISNSQVFNSNNAIPVKLVRPNSSYYPNAEDAVFSNSTQLSNEGFYTRTSQVVIPNFIFGAYYIHVITNATASLYEGSLVNNNIGNTLLQVFLTPTPLLTVNALSVPVTTASVTQPIGINWNVFNAGFNDNLQKNKGHYYLRTATPCDLGILTRDSMSFGSSFWTDNVYLSTDGSGLNSNAVLAGTAIKGSSISNVYADQLPPTICQPVNADPSMYDYNVDNIVKPASNYPQTLNFNVPAGLVPGNYYIYVLANAGKTVFEYPGTPQVKRSDLTIAIQRPDVSLSVTAPPGATGGQNITVGYSVMNNGPGAVYNHLRRDKVYVSTTSSFDASAELITTLSYTEDLPVTSPVAHSFTYTFPITASGNRYFYVQTNYDSAFTETSYANNTARSALVTLNTGTPVDLVVSSLQVADTVFSVFPAYLRYKVMNNGAGITSNQWEDSIFISCSPAYNPATAFLITKRIHTETIASGENYTDSFNVSFPLTYLINGCFPAANTVTAYFFVKTNADNGVFEAGNGNNNLLSSGARVVVNPLVDHIIISVSGTDTAIVARPYTTTWTVKNIGYDPGSNIYDGWYDVVYFSADSVLNDNAVQSNRFSENSRLQTNQTYTESKPVITPNIPTGDYYLLVKTNYTNAIPAEIATNNNSNLLRAANGAAKKIHVIQPLLPDLVDTILSSPVTAAIGQPITVIRRTTNTGAGVTYPDSWWDELYLSTDFIPDNGNDLRLFPKNHIGAVQPGQSYTDTMTTILPLYVTPGNYVFVSNVNSYRNVFETADNNNLATRVVTVYSPAPADLLVEKIIVPDTVYLGYTIDTAKWVVRNNSSNSAVGVSSDGIYLSKTNSLDSTAVLIGIKNKNINISPLSSDTVTLRPMISNLTEGSYNVIVKTDLLNNIVESNKNNNTTIATGALYVKVKELLLNTATVNTLQNINRFYKLHIPDSLRGSTILVTLKSNDSLTMKNEMYIGAGYTPSAAQFDYRYEIPNYGNQQIVMTSVTDSVYYITIRCASPNPLLQNITLKAVKLPFAILTVQSNSGGNIGNVTVKISGSLFVPGMTATLTHPGSTIASSTTYFTNSTSVYVTFNLQGRPLGLYDLALIKPDAATAVLPASFTVANANNGGLITGGGVNTGGGNGNASGCDPGAASGLNSQLVTELVIPAKVFVGWPFTIQINFSNPTNFDITTQARVLYNDKNVAMALTQAGLSGGTSSLYLELSEPGGPPGIIRAGASGTIIVYARAPLNTPGHSFGHFNLK